MKRVELPPYFTTLTRDKITLYVNKEYKNRMSEEDIDKLFNLCNDLYPGQVDIEGYEPNDSYHGRKSCKTLMIENLGMERYVVREYWHGGLFGRVLKDYFCDASRPLRELLICEAARKRHVNTTEIVAILKHKIIGPLYKFQLVTREIANSVDLIELFLRPDGYLSGIKKREIINKTAKAVKDMHDAGIYHADLHLKNILVQSDTEGGINVFIIDLDKSKQCENVSLQRRMKNIMRLDRSIVKMRRNYKDKFSKSFTFPVSRTDRIRFLKKYVGLGKKSVKPVRHYIQSYSKTHVLHKLWWSLGLAGKLEG